MAILKGPPVNIVQLRQLSKSYAVGTHKSAQWVPVLEDINLEIEQGELVSFVGPSGCGKTTILHIIAGITSPSSGSIYLDRLNNDSAEVDIGMAPQSPGLLPWFSVTRNVLLPALMSGYGQDRHLARLDYLLRLTGLTEFANAYPHQLSRGMAQKVSLCRALLLRPRVLLLDEPFSSLDAISQEHLDQVLEVVWRDQGVTTIFVTHDLNEAVFLSDRVVVLSRGPAMIQSVIPIQLSRPRGSETLQSVEFFGYVREIRQLLAYSAMQNGSYKGA